MPAAVKLRTTEVRQCWNSASGIAATTAALSPAIQLSLVIISFDRYVVLLIAYLRTKPRR